MAAAQGHTERAEQLLRDALTMMQQQQDRWSIRFALLSLGRLLVARGELHAAMQVHLEALSTHWSTNDPLSNSHVLDGMALVLTAHGAAGVAAQLFGAAHALRRHTGCGPWPYSKPDLERALKRLRCSLGDEAFEEQWQAGTQLNLEHAVDATSHASRSPSPPVASH